jgi:hypothetical protein
MIEDLLVTVTVTATSLSLPFIFLESSETHLLFYLFCRFDAGVI